MSIAEFGLEFRSEERRWSERWAMLSFSLCMLLSSLDTSIANTALPTLARAFHASFQHVQWIVLAYLLAVTTLIVSVGRLGDLFGRRRLLLAGLALFIAASVLCGIASSLWMLIAARAAQGIGAAFMMALTIALATEAVPKQRTGSAIGLLGTMSAVGTALGPSVGGLFIARYGWPSIFLVNAPLGLITLALAHRFAPMDRPARKSSMRFDRLGTLLLGGTLAAYSLAMTVDRERSLNVALLLAALLGIVLFVKREARAASPLIQLKMFRDASLSASLAMGALASTVIMSTLVVGPFFLARTLRLDAAMVGLVLSAGPLAAAMTGVPAGRLVDRYGTRRMTMVGLSGMAAGSLLLSFAQASLGVIGYIIPIMVITSHYALFQTANNTSMMTGVSPEQRGVVSGLISLSRNLGLITGAAVLGAVFAHAAGAIEISSTSPEAIDYGKRVTFAVAGSAIVLSLMIAWAKRRLASPCTECA